MNITNIKDLEAVLKLCRKHGVDKISIDGISLELGSMPLKVTSADTATGDEPLTDEDLLLWSARG